MSKSTKISLLFFIIFLAGVLGIISFVNESLNKKTIVEFPAKERFVVFSVVEGESMVSKTIYYF